MRKSTPFCPRIGFPYAYHRISVDVPSSSVSLVAINACDFGEFELMLVVSIRKTNGSVVCPFCVRTELDIWMVPDSGLEAVPVL